MSCFGAVDGLAGCGHCESPHTGPTGSLADGCADRLEQWVLLALFAVAGTVMFYLRKKPCAKLSLGFVGVVLMESSAYHVLFGEGVGQQPTAFLQAINSRATTVTVLSSAAALSITWLTVGCCGTSCCGPYWQLRSASAAYAVAAAAIAGVATYDPLIRSNGRDPDIVYGVFDAAGVFLGLWGIIAAASSDNVYADGDFKK